MLEDGPRRFSEIRGAMGIAPKVLTQTLRTLERDELLTHSVLECVGHGASMETAIRIARPGGAVGRVGVPRHTEIPGSLPAFFGNTTIGGGPAPVRAYVDELPPDVLEGRIDPGRVFDRIVGLDGVPDGYRAMADREAIKVMVTL